MVIQVFIAVGKGVDSLTQLTEMMVFYLVLVPGIGKATGHSLGQAKPPVDLSKQENAAITGDRSAAKINPDFTAFTDWKSDFGSGTVCHGGTSFVFQLNQPKYKGFLRFRRSFL